MNFAGMLKNWLIWFDSLIFIYNMNMNFPFASYCWACCEWFIAGDQFFHPTACSCSSIGAVLFVFDFSKEKRKKGLKIIERISRAWKEAAITLSGRVNRKINYSNALLSAENLKNSKKNVRGGCFNCSVVDPQP